MDSTTHTEARPYTVQELSDYLAVPVRTIYQWHTKGAGPRRMRVGRYVRFRPADVEAWLNEQTAP